MKCSLCGSQKMHTSRLRREDMVRLVFLQYPVRCRACLERGYVNLVRGLTLRQREKARHREERSRGKNGQSAAG
jgi:hypothetical protein